MTEHIEHPQDGQNQSAATTEPNTNRRRLLAIMGLAATTAYVAPTLLSMDEARASGGSGGGSGGRGSGGRGSGGRGSGGGRGGRGSRGSGGRGFGGRGRSGWRSGGRRAGFGNPAHSLERALRGIFR